MKRTLAVMAIGVALALGAYGAKAQMAQTPGRSAEIAATLTSPPNVPPAIERSGPARVVVDLETTEVTGQLANDVQYRFWTFGGTVPGPFIRVRVGDTIVLQLRNAKSSEYWHSIDLHAVTGPGGGAGATQVGPGEAKAFEWKALNPGIYVYHCATPHIPQHVANGMYGLILVEPETGLAKVDREYYVMQGEFYTKGRTLGPGLQAYDGQKARDERPEYVLFNGRMGSLMDKGALQARVGETVRLYVGNGGPNLISSFHVIGEIFDAVYHEGAIGSAPSRNVQTTLIPAGGAAIVEFKVDQPGRFLLVDHSIYRAMEKGALGSLVVSGEPLHVIFKALSPSAHAGDGH